MPDPAILKRAIAKIKKGGKSSAEARAIAVAVLQRAGDLKKGSTAPTAKGTKRGKMTEAQRKKTRAQGPIGRKRK